MTAPAPQQEYIITEEQLCCLEHTTEEDSTEVMDRIFGKVRKCRASHSSVQSPIPNNEQCRICSQAERDKVLDELINFVRRNADKHRCLGEMKDGVQCGKCPLAIDKDIGGYFDCKLESLRSLKNGGAYDPPSLLPAFCHLRGVVKNKST